MLSHSRLQELAHARELITGEAYAAAFAELRAQGPEPVIVPRAAIGEAGFEASLVDLLGQVDISMWPTGAPAFGFTRLTPRASELVAEVDPHCLIDIVKQLMPMDAGHGVHGMPGLRSFKTRNGVELSRPGEPGRILLRISMAAWKKATSIAVQEIVEEYDGEPPALFWVASPRDWHPAERAHVGRSPGRHAGHGYFYRHSAPLSVIFRHLNVWNIGENLDDTRLWTNGAMNPGHPYPIHFAWTNGPTHQEILAQFIHDPIFGAGQQFDQLLTRCRCHTGKYCAFSVMLETGNKFFLRRATEDVRLSQDQLPDIGYYKDRLRRRTALCEQQGLPGPFADISQPRTSKKHDRSNQRRRLELRRMLTGETKSTARRYLAALPATGPVIPAACTAQAVLEVRYALAFGRPTYEAWQIKPAQSRSARPEDQDVKYPPFGITFVTPLRDELRLVIHPDLLPNMINNVLPLGLADDAEDDGSEINGIAGLRAKVGSESVLLRRIGAPGKIRIMVDRIEWGRAVQVALLGVPPQNVLWQRHPERWTQREILFETEHPWVREYGSGNQLISGMLRRIRVLDGFGGDNWNLWADRQLKIYWRGGSSHKTVVDRLLRRDVGLNLKHGYFNDCRCLDDAGHETNTCGLVSLDHSSGLELYLKRNPRYKREPRPTRQTPPDRAAAG